MNTVERLAALRALRHGLDSAIAVAEEEIRHVRQLTGARSFTTSLGSVTIAQRKPSIRLDSDAFLDWCRENAPGEIVESVRPSFEKAVKARLRVAGGDVVDGDGVVVDYATATEGSEYITVKLSDDAKDSAAEQVLERVETLAGFLEVES